jgi:hypothetical protein
VRAVEGIGKNITTSAEHGDYYRPLAPGDYIITIEADGYIPFSASAIVPDDGSGVVLNAVLQQLPGMDGSHGADPNDGALAAYTKGFASDQLLLLAAAPLLLQGLRMAHIRLKKRASDPSAWQRAL